jgi:hypothetical protein
MKTTLLILALAIAANSFQIRADEAQAIVVDEKLGGIPWPFTLCGDADWVIESLTLGQTPKRNINDDIVTVYYIYILDRNCQISCNL